jgi:hypothetical protein
LEVGGVDEVVEGDELLTIVGASDGSWVGIIVGSLEGSFVSDGLELFRIDGVHDGALDGKGDVGLQVGFLVGFIVG